MTATPISIHNLWKIFVSATASGRGRGLPGILHRAVVSRRRRVEAVRGISLEIEKGEVFGLLGPNGSGKSTTIKILLGLLAPTSGVVRIFGAAPTDVATKHCIGFLPEESYLYRFLNAEETLRFYGKLFGIPRKERNRRINHLLDLVGLERLNARKRPIREYSKGMARRIGLAQALINDPQLVILDEPTTGLDPIGTAEMKALIQRLKAEGKTVLLSSHLLADVEAVCDRVAILCDGDLLASGTLGELLTLGNRLRVDVLVPDGGGGDPLEARLRAFLESEGVSEYSITPPTDSLARLFLKLVAEKDPARIPKNLQGSEVAPAPDAGA